MEHDFEPVRGLPAELPAGERLLWQGAPTVVGLARHVFRAHWVGMYFGVLAVWRALDGLSGGEGLSEALIGAAWVLPFGALAVGLLVGLAWINARTTVYTVTTRRVVMRYGAAFTKAINIPFNIIESASLNRTGGDSGDVAIQLKSPDKIAYLILWPHARPGRLANPQPAFRCLPDALTAADALARALREHAGQPEPAMQTASGTGRSGTLADAGLSPPMGAPA